MVITNINEWFIFDATIFDRLFAQNKSFVKQFEDFEWSIGGYQTDFFTDRALLTNISFTPMES